MDSPKLNESGNRSNNLLIDWSTPEIIRVKSHDDNLVNNPFDVLELKAANMDPFDLVPNNTLFKVEPPCANILSPETERFFLFKDDIVDDQSKNSHVIVDIVEDQSKNDHITVDIINDQSKNDHVTVGANKGNVDQSKIYCEAEDETEKEEQITKSSFTYDTYEIEKMPLCDEDEKEQIREKTRQHIEMIIEKGRKHENSLCYTPAVKSESSSNRTKTFLNNGFMLNNSDEISESRNINRLSKKLDMLIDIHASSYTAGFHFEELNSFDLNSVKPDWIMDNINSDSDSLTNVSNMEKGLLVDEDTSAEGQVDDKLKTLNNNGIIESQLNGCQTILKLMKNERVKTKGPCIANIPIQQMVKDFMDEDIKDKNNLPGNPFNRLKPVASSTPTSDNSDMSPNSHNSSVLSGLSRRSLPNYNESPSTPLNVTKCIKFKSPNILLKNITADVENKKTLPKAAKCLINSTNTNRRSNSSLNLYNGGKHGKNTEIIKSFQSNKSKSESKIDKIPKLSTAFAKPTSGLPVPKRIYHNGKENIKPHV